MFLYLKICKYLEYILSGLLGFTREAFVINKNCAEFCCNAVWNVRQKSLAY